jgi:glycerol-3-phosphate dehydrogenase
LSLYDQFAHDPKYFPQRSVHRVGESGLPAVSGKRYRWLAGYWDAQIRYPERYVQALLADAQVLAHEAGATFRVLTYHRARKAGGRIELVPMTRGTSADSESLEPAAIVNATGAWVDLTLQELAVKNTPLMGGTKGSHFITFHEGLRAALGEQALYAEADDGRPIFVLPFGVSVLVGTTDIPYSGRPEDALASDEELDYLVTAVNEIFPQVALTRADLELHYCGVRPLPASHAATPASVTRRHKLVTHEGESVPTFSIVGGKLTTSRQLAEEATATILAKLGKTVTLTSRKRPVPGGENYPATKQAMTAANAELAREFSLDLVQVTDGWKLFGARLRKVLVEAARDSAADVRPWMSLDSTSLALPMVRWIISHEGPRTLDDLVERRLMLLYHRPLTTACLRQLAGMLADAGVIQRDEVNGQVASTVRRLTSHFGKRVVGE